MNSIIIKIGKDKKCVTISNNSKIKIENQEYLYELIHLQNSTYLLKVKNQFFKINYLQRKNDNHFLSINGKKYITSTKSVLKEKAEELVARESSNSNAKLLKAPMPGMVLDLKFKVGEKVQNGETLLILEAMKMENAIKSPFGGVIKENICRKE